jgi:fatty-acyl-CoA synthase
MERTGVTPSQVIGANEPALLETTIGAALAAMARQRPDADALIAPFQQLRWSWAELDARVDALATGLLARGLKKGDRVGIWSPNRAEWALTQFATAKAGLILVNINPAYRLSEVEYALNRVGCRALITAPSFKTSDYVGMLRQLGPQRLPGLEFIAVLGDEDHAGCVRFDALSQPADRALLDQVAATLDCRDPINIQFTSGTTGAPKGATLTHRNILNNGRFVGARIGLRPDDRVCIPVPLYHCFGMVMGNLACVTSGAAMVYPGEGFEPRAVLEAVANEHCTALYGVPTMFIAILNHPDFDGFDLSSLRTGIMAGSPCPSATMREVLDRMHMREVTIAYGMTETSPVSFQTSPDDPLTERVTTVGQIQPHLESRIVDRDGNTVPRGEQGELCTRGYSVMQGYWEDPARTAEAIDADGWMHTGDLATIDDAGYCRITGRIKDMVIRGGENVYPKEIEDYLMTHPGIADAQVIGVPDARYGEEICVWIMLRPGSDLAEADVLDHCRGQIAHYKIPRHIRFVAEFPMTVTGKVQKFEMRRIMISELDGH